MPGPLMTAPRRIFLPFFKVSFLETTSSRTILRSPSSITASSPLSHHMEAPFEPTDKRTSFISSGQSIMVTAQNKTPYLGFLNEVAKRKSFTLNSLLSSACHFSFSFPTFTMAPSLGTVSICLGKYCVWNISFR